MMLNRSKAWTAVCAGALLLGFPAATLALTTLRVELTNATCGISGDSGITHVDCTSLSDLIGLHAIGLQADIGLGETAFVSATLRYTYSDDGLPLADPGIFQLDPEGFDWIYTDYEAAGLYVQSNLCQHARYCPRDPNLQIFGSETFPPLLLGMNSTPDRVSGQIELNSQVGVLPSYPFPPLSVPVYVGWAAEVYSSVIPEPASHALMAIGLATVLLVCRRRARLASNSRLDQSIHAA